MGPLVISDTAAAAVLQQLVILFLGLPHCFLNLAVVLSHFYGRKHGHLGQCSERLHTSYHHMLSSSFLCAASHLNKHKKGGEELELLDFLDGQEEHDIILSFN